MTTTFTVGDPGESATVVGPVAAVNGTITGGQSGGERATVIKYYIDDRLFGQDDNADVYQAGAFGGTFGSALQLQQLGISSGSHEVKVTVSGRDGHVTELARQITVDATPTLSLTSAPVISTVYYKSIPINGSATNWDVTLAPQQDSKAIGHAIRLAWDGPIPTRSTFNAAAPGQVWNSYLRSPDFNATVSAPFSDGTHTLWVMMLGADGQLRSRSIQVTLTNPNKPQSPVTPVAPVPAPAATVAPSPAPPPTVQVTNARHGKVTAKRGHAARIRIAADVPSQVQSIKVYRGVRFLGYAHRTAQGWVFKTSPIRSVQRLRFNTSGPAGQTWSPVYTITPVRK